MATLEQILAVIESGQEGNPVELANQLFAEPASEDKGILNISQGQGKLLENMDFTGKVTASDRFQTAVNAISAIYPVQTDQYYQEAAEGMYPEQAYEKEKFWNDIQLGLSLISGRSEGGQWAPIINQSLQDWLGAGAPISQAEREREGQIAQTAQELKKEDSEAFREMMGQAFLNEQSEQLRQGLKQFKVLTQAEAAAKQLPTERGQVWRENTLTGEVTQLQGIVPTLDKFRILSTAEAKKNQLPTEQGQVYKINEANGDITQLLGAQVGINMDILSTDEAIARGLPVDHGQLYQVDRVTKKVTQLYGITQRPENFSVLSSENAATMELDTSKGQIWQRNNTTGFITLLQTAQLPSDEWIVLDEKTAAGLGLPVERGGVWMQNKKNGNIKPLLSPANISEREKKISALSDILKNEKWGATTTDEGVELPSDQEVINQATKMVDGIIDMVVQEDGRIYIVDQATNTRTLVNPSGDRGKYPLIGSIDQDNPFAYEEPPTDFTVDQLTTGAYEEAQRQITNLSYAMVEAEDLIEVLEEVLGPQNWFKSALTGTFAVLPSGADEWAKFIKTSRGQKQVELFARVLIQALALNPRYPVAEQELINKLNAEGIKFFLDKKVGWANFNETLRFITNRLSFNRNTLQAEPTSWWRIKAEPSGTKNDPIYVDQDPSTTTKGEAYINYIVANGGSLDNMYVSFDGGETSEIIPKGGWSK